MPEIYISTDIEADGPIPGPNSMLSIGAAAFREDKTLISTFSANLKLLPGAAGDPKTMEWWGTQPDTWEATRKDARDPAVVMADFVQWVNGLPGKPVFVGYPVAYDFMFVYWYMIRFTGGSPFSHSALDIKTLAMAALGTGYRDSTKRNMPKQWFEKLPHNHVAVDDAIGQGVLFCNALAEVRRQSRGE
jgi:3' exoribonuclease, RNase T-like